VRSLNLMRSVQVGTGFFDIPGEIAAGDHDAREN
jgi:hypothetical protein